MLHIDGAAFKDNEGRTVLLRGVNLGGSSKVPTRPNGATYRRWDLFHHQEVSFIGRPLPLDAADEHFSRLRHWGFNFLRLLTTWEAVEHEGPGIYDEAYLDYFEAIVRKAAEYGFYILIDPHQDAWSRFSGGDGAPGWTLETVGFDLTNLHATGAAFLHQFCDGPYPRMIWPTNATKLAAATMFTLFFAGDHFAPRTRIEGESVQSFLQRHYVDSLVQIAHRLTGIPNVLGFDTMNEPSPGFIGWTDLSITDGMVKLGPMPSPYQSMLLGEGQPQEVDVWETGLLGIRRAGREVLNQAGLRAWRQGFRDVWRENGVWDFDDGGAPHLLRPNHFAEVNGQDADFARDFYRPFANRTARELRRVAPGALIFIEIEPNQPPPRWKAEDASNIVYAPHWYDGYVLYMKDFQPHVAVDVHSQKIVFGRRRIRRSFIEQLGKLKNYAKMRLEDIPIVIGETGIAFDLNRKRAYRTGDFRHQISAMDRSMHALEQNLLSYAIWNYTVDNDNKHGDLWNEEDFSIFSYDQQSDPADIHSGGRALLAVLRPFPYRTPGEPISLSFEYRKRLFEYSFQNDYHIVNAPCEIYVPEFHYPDGYSVEISDGSFEKKPDEQRLLYHPSGSASLHRICIWPTS
jgi:hypothetical protein